MRPIPCPLYPCIHCAAEVSHYADDLWWSERLSAYVCMECWDFDSHGDRLETLAQEIEKQKEVAK
jgi:DNA-directed RNA polymerase subunit RPC12/RpoP